MLKATVEELNAISGIGEVIATAFVDYFSDNVHRERLRNLLAELIIPKKEADSAAQIFSGVNFVITGSVEHFANRNEVKESKAWEAR